MRNEDAMDVAGDATRAPAFPTRIPTQEGPTLTVPGLSARGYFAARFAPGIWERLVNNYNAITGDGRPAVVPEYSTMASMAYALADAMLVESERTTEPKEG